MRLKREPERSRMSRGGDTAFYSEIQPFGDSGQLMKPSLYHPLSKGWLIGIFDIVRSADGERHQRARP